ncbi:MAG: glycosyltransferase family 4 protein [Bacteroidetes bacterium]|nr:glycosyltransferase family 4 protein [Bacteroidota bacterium]
MAPAKIVFLYTELAGYFLACVEELSKSAQVLIVRWPVNKEAPFDFSAGNAVTIHDRNQLSDEELLKLVHGFKPDIVVCSGWIDKGYLKVARSFKRNIPVIVSLDNHWTGSWKQQLAALSAPYYLRRIFTHAWVPGKPQQLFAQKLGFGENILLNFYCADVPLFDGVYERTMPAKKATFPHRFLYVARYVEHKGIFELWNAFVQLQKETASDWELWCIGTGDQWNNRLEHEKIRHIGFVQPRDLENYIAETGVYILPSKFEPWGVTVQEFAVCGFPLLVSDCVGSGTRFLADNGMQFKAGSVEELKIAMKKVMDLPDTELIRMAEKSHQLGVSLTPAKWAENLLSVLKN